MKPVIRNQCIVNTVFSLMGMRLTQPCLPRSGALEYSLVDNLV
ncbi:hypothetical protein [Paraburkholderia aromaticivorans]|nr:hypothetical protein [Paraburkholderia aromaticivorans]